MKYKATGIYLFLLLLVCNVETNAGSAYSTTMAWVNNTQLRDGTFADSRLINKITEGLERLMIDHVEALQLLARKYVSGEDIIIPLDVLELWGRCGILVKDSSILSGGVNLKVPQSIVRCALVVTRNGGVELRSPIKPPVGTGNG